MCHVLLFFFFYFLLLCHFPSCFLAIYTCSVFPPSSVFPLLSLTCPFSASHHLHFIPSLVCVSAYSLCAPSCFDGLFRFLLWVCRASSEPVSSVSSSVSPFVPTVRVLDFVPGFVSPLSSGLNFAFFSVLRSWFVPCLAFCVYTVFWCLLFFSKNCHAVFIILLLDWPQTCIESQSSISN